jgi:hypothetical protein
MSSYAFDLMNRDGSIESFDLGAFDTDIEALRHARSALLASLTAFAVEVWSDGVRIGRIRRDLAGFATVADLGARDRASQQTAKPGAA